MDNRKQVVSVRLKTADLAKVKEIAQRVRVRESDVYRFALRSTLDRLAPIYDPDMRGNELLPIFIDLCLELASYFELDTDRLDALINGDLGDGERRLEKDDIRLLSMLGTSEQYAYVKFCELSKKPVETAGLPSLVRDYLREKYTSASPEPQLVDD